MANTYIFMERINGEAQEVAKVVFDGNTATWSGDTEYKEMVVGEEFAETGGEPFDDTNPSHLEMLPFIISGDYLWVVEE
ncbi:hypothetical protein MUP59_00365 [Candidatus Bathyarchaeota archaeon]|nr:hypothetical protein [Candidatus Bathyarchaeota archaeon]